jgi:hypothetical protein
MATIRLEVLAILALAFWLGRYSVRAGERASSCCTEDTRFRLDEVAAEVQPLLSKPPKNHGLVKVPSVLRDARGAVHNLMVGGFRFNVLESRKGSLRSGDVHRTPQHDVIFSGRVSVTTREHGVDVSRQYAAGESLVIPAHVPHIFRFLNDTVMAEWWDGPFEARFFKPYRQVVDQALRDAEKSKRNELHLTTAAAAPNGERLSSSGDSRLSAASSDGKRCWCARRCWCRGEGKHAAGTAHEVGGAIDGVGDGDGDAQGHALPQQIEGATRLGD